jgi:hypothetical protein
VDRWFQASIIRHFWALDLTYSGTVTAAWKAHLEAAGGSGSWSARGRPTTFDFAPAAAEVAWRWSQRVIE